MSKQTYGPHIITNGLTLFIDPANDICYPKTGNQIFDLSKTKYVGSLVNSPSYSLDGNGTFLISKLSQQYINFDNVYDFSVTNEFTLSIWLKSSVENWEDTGWMISKRLQFIIHPLSGTKTVQFYVNHSNTSWAAVSYTPAVINVYNQYVFSYKDGNIDIYLNSQKVSSSSTVWTPLSTDGGSLTIGRDDGQSRYGSGYIGPTMIYNRKLTDEEVNNNYTCFKGRFL